MPLADDLTTVLNAVPNLRALGVAELEIGDLRLRLAPLPVSAPVAEPRVEIEPQERGPDGLTRAEADELYYSSGP